MTQYINKSDLVAEIEKIKSGLSPNFYEYDYDVAKVELLEKIEKFLDTLEVKEIETPVIPKYSYFEEIYHCGSEPRWKIGDVLAVYEFYSDYEREYIYGKITDVKMDETEDWCYTFENGDMVYENRLISDETYKKINIMKHYIDKDALIAEIERIKKEECPTDSYEGRCKLLWFEQFLSFIDTLEVKKVIITLNGDD